MKADDNTWEPLPTLSEIWEVLSLRDDDGVNHISFISFKLIWAAAINKYPPDVYYLLANLLSFHPEGHLLRVRETKESIPNNEAESIIRSYLDSWDYHYSSPPYFGGARLPDLSVENFNERRLTGEALKRHPYPKYKKLLSCEDREKPPFDNCSVSWNELASLVHIASEKTKAALPKIIIDSLDGDYYLDSATPSLKEQHQKNGHKEKNENKKKEEIKKECQKELDRVALRRALTKQTYTKLECAQEVSGEIKNKNGNVDLYYLETSSIEKYTNSSRAKTAALFKRLSDEEKQSLLNLFDRPESKHLSVEQLLKMILDHKT